MSSFVRRLQIRAWRGQAKKPFNHNARHGGKVRVLVPGTSLEVERPRFAWPLLARDFVQEEAAA